MVRVREDSNLKGLCFLLLKSTRGFVNSIRTFSTEVVRPDADSDRRKV